MDVSSPCGEPGGLRETPWGDYARGVHWNLRLISALVATSLAIVTSPSTVAAQDASILVLGIRSVDGDDEFTTALTGVIRHHARSIPGWSINEADLSLDQAMLIQGCDVPDTSCMGMIAGEMGTDKVLFGTVRRTTADSNADFALSLELYDAATGAMEHSLTDVVPRIRSDVDDLRPRARRYVLELAGQERFGTILVRSNTPAAAVQVDGHDAGLTNENGQLRINDVREGLHSVSVEADERESFEATARVVANEEIELVANLITAEPRDLRWIAGTSALAVGAAFAVVGVVGTTRAAEFQSARQDAIDGVSRSYSAEVENYVELLDRAVAAGPNEDVCQNAGTTTPSFGLDSEDDFRIRTSACNAITEAHNLQIAGYTIGAAMGIAGGVLLWWALGDDAEDSAAAQVLRRVQVYPQMSDTEAGVGLNVAF